MIRFTKMHGCGNDYVYVDTTGTVESIEDPGALAVGMSDRHTGIGADGLIFIGPPEDDAEADMRMRMFNADGSESEMCGNGIRCVCKYAHDHGICCEHPMCIQTAAGVLTLEYTHDERGLVDQVTVDMGEPELSTKKVPVNEEELAWIGANPHHGFEVEDACFIGVFVSMGNPHVVLLKDEHPELMAGALDEFDLSRWGPRIEHHPAFPNRINAHIVEVHSPSEVTMRTWERGSGITRACGTGACAVCVAGVLSGRTGREVLAHLPGGDLQLRWDESTNHVFMTGPAVEVFSGEWDGEGVRC